MTDKIYSYENSCSMDHAEKDRHKVYLQGDE